LDIVIKHLRRAQADAQKDALRNIHNPGQLEEDPTVVEHVAVLEEAIKALRVLYMLKNFINGIEGEPTGEKAKVCHSGGCAS
jgi:hypothetical protein